MQTLELALRNKQDEGDPLPCPVRSFRDVGIKFRRGQLSLIAAAPGGGKSSLATHLAVRMKVPTVYVSADCDRSTVGSAILAGVADIELSEAEAALEDMNEEALQDLALETEHIWWSFRSSPSLQDIQDEILAFAFVQGDWPELIIVDNLMDINEAGEEFNRYTAIILTLVDIARETGAHVMLLHHVTGGYQDGTEPIPRSGIRYKVSEKPRLVLTLHKPEEGIMAVRVVKNTGGPAHTKAEFGCDIAWLPERGWISG